MAIRQTLDRRQINYVSVKRACRAETEVTGSTALANHHGALMSWKTYSRWS